jgi:hypothetical protein
MSNFSPQHRQLSPCEVTAIYTRLHPQEVEQFYTRYQLWTIQQRMACLQTAISSIQQQIAENAERMQQVQPSSLALATLSRLQANGVNDIDLLERLLDRGEDWLEQTMQHLTYCQEIDVIQGNYTEWCQHALEGAYEWIGSIQHTESAASTDEIQAVQTSTIGTSQTSSLDEATEERLLQKLLSDEPEDDRELLLAPTLKRSSVSPRNEPLHAPSQQIMDGGQPERRAGVGPVEYLEPEAEPLPVQAAEDNSPTEEQLPLSEVDTSTPLQATQKDTPSGTIERIPLARMHRKRSFLQWFFSLFFR